MCIRDRYDSGIYLVNGTEIVPESESGKVKKLTGKDADQASARKGTIAYSILEAHNTSGDIDVYKRQKQPSSCRALCSAWPTAIFPSSFMPLA